jgi:NAD(P)-dependent dehydrogenase (short-subunit alcohol dehydrogenase family)
MFQADFLKGKNTFVAGGTSGMNREIAAAYAKAGANVAVLSRSKDKVEDTIAYLKGINSEIDVLGFAVDVRDYDGVCTAMATAADKFGLLDIVVSGAAGLFIAPAEKLSANAFKTVVDIDLLGSFHVLRAAYEHTRKPGASFINITAPQAKAPFWGQAHACAAKAGLNMLTESLAYEWGSHGVRVNAISPGFIQGTEGFNKFTGTPEMTQMMLDRVPSGEFGTTEDIANMALFLASDVSRHVNGEIIRVDGGHELNGGLMLKPEMLG